jgi:hypothetical protein
MAGRNGNQPRSIDLTIWGISDTEILGIVDDLADADGWTATIEVRLQLGENVEDTGHRSGVGPRLSWLRRYGWLEQHPDDRRRWQLTPMGHAILDRPNLPVAVERALTNINPAQRVQLTRELAEGAGRSEYRTALRRQWVRSLGR